MDFGHRVGGTLFNPASLTNGCMGKHCGVKPSWDYRRCTEAKESPGRAGALRTNKKSRSHKTPRHYIKAQITQGIGSRQGQFRGPKSLFYLSEKTGVALKTKRCSRFASRRSSVFEPVSLSLSMMSWIIPQ